MRHRTYKPLRQARRSQVEWFDAQAAIILAALAFGLLTAALGLPF